MLKVVRNSDRVIMMKVVLEDKEFNIVSAYAPQVGLQEETDEVMQGIPWNKDIVIKGNLINERLWILI